jgi:hypothetical protein
LTHFYKIKCDFIPQSEYLNQLIKLCDHSIIKNNSFEKEVCNDFNIEQQNDYPVAAILADEEFTSDSKYTFFQATPCYFSLQRDYYKFEKNLENECSPDELNTLCVDLNQHFSTNDQNFFIFENKLFFATIKNSNISTYFAEEINQVPYRGFLPFGQDEAWWHKFINELQMFLFDYPANKKREEKGQYPINSIWFSGGGKKIKADIGRKDKIVFSDLMLLKKIALLNLEGVEIESFTKNDYGKEDCYLYHHIFEAKTEYDVFKVILEDVKSKKISNLNLSLFLGSFKILFKTNFYRRLKFWCHKKDLQEILNEA